MSDELDQGSDAERLQSLKVELSRHFGKFTRWKALCLEHDVTTVEGKIHLAEEILSAPSTGTVAEWMTHRLRLQDSKSFDVDEMAGRERPGFEEGRGVSAEIEAEMGFKEWLLDETLALAGNYKGGIYQRLVAASYKLAPVNDPAARPAFEELARKMARQSDFLKHDYRFVPSSGDHYASLKQLRRSIDSQRQAGKRRADMYVYAEPPGPEGDTSQQGHPVYSNDQNVMIRGVHDALAHLGGDHPFSARGEYGAYNRHLKTLCNVQDAKAGSCLAAGALFTEIVGQTSFYYVYGQFAPQKAVILPDFDHYNVGLLAPASRLNAFFVLQNKALVCRPDFDAQVFVREFTALSQELSRQVGGPKVRLASIPVRQ